MGKNTGVYDKEPCPLCGEKVKLLPAHLPECPEAGGVGYDH